MSEIDIAELCNSCEVVNENDELKSKILELQDENKKLSRSIDALKCCGNCIKASKCSSSRFYENSPCSFWQFN